MSACPTCGTSLGWAGSMSPPALRPRSVEPARLAVGDVTADAEGATFGGAPERLFHINKLTALARTSTAMIPRVRDRVRRPCFSSILHLPLSAGLRLETAKMISSRSNNVLAELGAQDDRRLSLGAQRPNSIHRRRTLRREPCGNEGGYDQHRGRGRESEGIVRRNAEQE